MSQKRAAKQRIATVFKQFKHVVLLIEQISSDRFILQSMGVPIRRL